MGLRGLVLLVRLARVGDSGLKGRFPVAQGNARGTRIKAHKAVPEFTANAFADHHRRIRLASLCEPKTMNPLRCSGGMPSTTPHFAGHDKALARAFLTRGTNVDWGRGADLLRLKKAVFFWGLWVRRLPGLKPRLRFLSLAPFLTRRTKVSWAGNSSSHICRTQWLAGVGWGEVGWGACPG